MRKWVQFAKRNRALGRLIPALGDAWRFLVISSSDDSGLGQLQSSRHPSAAKILAALKAAKAGGSAASLMIEPLRQKLIQDRQLLVSEGTVDNVPWDENVTISEAARASKPPRQSLLLHALALEFSCEDALELGTNVGVSSAYIATAVAGKVWSLDASPSRISLAQRLHEEAMIRNVEIITGLFDDTLEGVLSQIESLDFAFIDGNHQEDATLRYFDRIVPKMKPGGLVVFDDIHWSAGMTAAWRRLRENERLSLTIDLWDLGIGVVRSEGDPVNHLAKHGSWLKGIGPPTRNLY